MHRDMDIDPRVEAGERPDYPPRAADALKSCVVVSVSTWSGCQLQGTVFSDRDEAGLLIDLEDEREGYAFLPWSSVERVDIPEVAHRRVKFLQG